jgi:hypothetical protein
MIASLEVCFRARATYSNDMPSRTRRAAVMLHDQESMVVFFKDGNSQEKRRGKRVIDFD